MGNLSRFIGALSLILLALTTVLYYKNVRVNNKLNTLSLQYDVIVSELEFSREMEALRNSITEELLETKRIQEHWYKEQSKELRRIEDEINSTKEGRHCNTIPDDVWRLLQSQPSPHSCTKPRDAPTTYHTYSGEEVLYVCSGSLPESC